MPERTHLDLVKIAVNEPQVEQIVAHLESKPATEGCRLWPKQFAAFGPTTCEGDYTSLQVDVEE